MLHHFSPTKMTINSGTPIFKVRSPPFLDKPIPLNVTKITTFFWGIKLNPHISSGQKIPIFVKVLLESRCLDESKCAIPF